MSNSVSAWIEFDGKKATVDRFVHHLQTGDVDGLLWTPFGEDTTDHGRRFITNFSSTLYKKKHPASKYSVWYDLYPFSISVQGRFIDIAGACGDIYHFYHNPKDHWKLRRLAQSVARYFGATYILYLDETYYGFLPLKKEHENKSMVELIAFVKQERYHIVSEIDEYFKREQGRMFARQEERSMPRSIIGLSRRLLRILRLPEKEERDEPFENPEPPVIEEIKSPN